MSDKIKRLVQNDENMGPPQNRRFCGERRSDGVNELSRLRGSEAKSPKLTVAELNGEIQNLRRLIDKSKTSKMTLWEEYHSGAISRDVFQRESDKLTEQVATYEEKITELESECKKLEVHSCEADTFVERHNLITDTEKGLPIKMASLFFVSVFIFIPITTNSKKENTIMAKTRLEKIADYEEQIAQIKNRQKQERQKFSKEEQNARTRRLCSRHGLLEKMLPEIVAISDEQYQAFLEKAVTNTYARDILNKIISQRTVAKRNQRRDPSPHLPINPPQPDRAGLGARAGNGATTQWWRANSVP